MTINLTMLTFVPYHYSFVTFLPRAGLNKSGNGYGVDLEARINAAVLAIPLCGECKVMILCYTIFLPKCTCIINKVIFLLHRYYKFCLEPELRKLCSKRREVRRDLIEEEMIRVPAQKQIVPDTNAPKPSTNNCKSVGERKKPGRKKGWNKIIESSPSYIKPKGASKGSTPMAMPDHLLPVFARLISANGTSQRMDVINGFIKDHPETSARQATIKFTELTTKDKPSCITMPDKKTGKGRQVTFYVRPRYYHMLPDEERPTGWEEAAKADEVLYVAEREAKAKARAERDQKMRSLMTDKGAESDDGTQNSNSEMNSYSMTSFTGNGSDNDDDDDGDANDDDNVNDDEDNDDDNDDDGCKRPTKKRKA